MFTLSARNHSKVRAVPILWLLAWSGVQPLLAANAPPVDSDTCSSGSASSCMQQEGVSLLQARSRMSKIDTDKAKSLKKSIKDCTICKEIAKEVESQVKTEVSDTMKTARITIEKELLREILLRHNTTMKELERIVEKHVTADLQNAQKVKALEEKVQHEFVDEGVLKKMNSDLDSIETRVTTVETELKEIESVIEEIKDSVSRLTDETSVFVKETEEKISALVTLIKETSITTRTDVLNKVVSIIQTETTKFSEKVLEQTTKRITESIAKTLVKVEIVIKESIEKEKEAHEIEHESIKEKIKEEWEKVTTIVKELQEAIKESTEAISKNKKEIDAVKESIEGIVIQVAEKVVGEHAKITEGSLSDLADSLEDLEVTIDEERQFTKEREADLQTLRELISTSQEKVVKAAEKYIEKETEVVTKGSDKALEKLKLELQNVKSSAAEDKNELEEVGKQLTTLKEKVASGKEERIKNTEAIAVLKKDAVLVKEMINEVKSDLEAHKESHQQETLREVTILLQEGQQVMIEKATEITVKEMSKEIMVVKESLETKIESTVIIMEEGQKKAKQEQEEQETKLAAKLELLKKQVELNAESNEKIQADQDALKETIEKLNEVVELGKEEHEMTNADIKDLKEYVDMVASEMEEQKGQFPTKEGLDKLVGAVTKVNAKVIAVSDKADTQTKLREESISTLEQRVTANEEHIIELEEELSGMEEQVMDIAGVLKELHNRQDEMKDEAVKKALAAVGEIVQEETESVIKEGMKNVRAKVKTMMNQVTKSVEVLEGRIEGESKKRIAADEQLSILQKKITSLTAAMETKADTSTVEKVSKTVGMIQSTIRKEKEVRIESAKETKLVKQAMYSVYMKMQSMEKEVQTVKEKHQVHHIHHVVQEESGAKIMKVSAQVKDIEAAASADIMKLRGQLKAANEKLAADEAARMESDASLKMLQESTMELFKRVASNSEKVAALDTKITEKIDMLAQALREVSIKMSVSAQASKGDTARISKMLSSLMAEISAEEEARRSGDMKMEKSIMSRVQVLIEELVSVSKKVSSGADSSSHCFCKETLLSNGEVEKVCKQDGEVVPSCDDAQDRGRLGIDSEERIEELANSIPDNLIPA